MPRDFFVSAFLFFCVQSLASNSQFVAASDGAHTFFEPVPAEGPMCEEGIMVSVTVPDALSEMPRDALQQSLQSQVFVYLFGLFYFMVPDALSEMPRDALQQSLQSQVFFLFIWFILFLWCRMRCRRCRAMRCGIRSRKSPSERTHS